MGTNDIGNCNFVGKNTQGTIHLMLDTLKQEGPGVAKKLTCPYEQVQLFHLQCHIISHPHFPLPHCH